MGATHNVAGVSRSFAPRTAGRDLLLAAMLAVLLLPVATIVWLALGRSDGALWHLAATVLPTALLDTITVMAGTAVVTVVFGTLTAWIVTMYRFPGRGWLDYLLVLPFAVPAYILAYVYVDLLDYAGPVQTMLRQGFGWSSARDYAFPDIRSRTGAVCILSAALYPYVYLAARASFVQQSVCVLEVARTLGRSSTGAFLEVALPMARPAIAAGTVLVLMETMNEFGAMQHLGIGTLTVQVYTTWLERGSLAGAAQIAVASLAVVTLLLYLERRTRADARYHGTSGRFRAIPFQDLGGWKAAGAIALCAVPPLIGFLVPFVFLARAAVLHITDAFEAGFWAAAGRSVLMAALAALCTVGIGLMLAYVRRTSSRQLVVLAVAGAGLGYALPGTVLALGLKLPLSGADLGIDAFVRMITGWSSGLLLSGTIVILVLAYVIRFLAVALGSLEAGFERISPNLDAAARTLGETSSSILTRIYLPLLVFVDTMKELPVTLLLRPFNFETLATQIHAQVALEKLEAAALGALAIVMVGLLPVILLHRAVATGRAGSRT